MPVKVTFKYPLISENNMIEHSESIHCLGIQNSKFIKIQSDMNNIRDLYNRYKGGLFNVEHKNFDKIKNWTGKVELNYCHEQ